MFEFLVSSSVITELQLTSLIKTNTSKTFEILIIFHSNAGVKLLRKVGLDLFNLSPSIRNTHVTAENSK